MSPLYSLTTLRRETQAELLRSDNPVITLALQAQLKSLTNLDTRHRVDVSRTRNERPAPIRSARISAQTLPDKPSHWSWNESNHRSAKRLERFRESYVSFFNEQPSVETLNKLAKFKSWKSALTALGLSYFLDLTPEAIAEDRQVFLQIFNKKINH